jgi:hypothetical protein
MKGLQFLLQSLGINIDPAQIEQAFQQGKDALPKLAKEFEVFNARLARMEATHDAMNSKLELLLSRTSGEVQPDPVHEQAYGTMSAEQLQAGFVNGSPELVVRNG